MPVRHAVAAIAVTVNLAWISTTQAAPPASQPTATTPILDNNAAAAVQRLLASPDGEPARAPLRDDWRLQDAAWPALVAVVRQDRSQRRFPNRIVPAETAPPVLEALAHINPKRSADLVLEMTHDASPKMRITALSLLNDPVPVGAAPARRRVREALVDPDGGVVAEALNLLAAHPDADAGPAALDIVLHPPAKPMASWDMSPTPGESQRELPASALKALAAIGYGPAVNDLIGLVGDPTAARRAAVASALGACAAHADAPARGRAADRLALLLTDPHPQVRLAAGGALADLGDARGAPPLVADLRRGLSLVPDTFGDCSISLSYTVAHLEHLSKLNLGTSAGADAWDLRANTKEDDGERQLAAFTTRLKADLATLQAHGFTDAGYPAVPDHLTATDRALFDGWFGSWLVDPRGGRFVKVPVVCRSCWGGVGPGTVDGWQLPAGQLVTADGDPLVAAGPVTPIDLTVIANAALAPPTAPDDPFVGMRQTANPSPSATAPIVLAAWAYRMGDEPLSAKLLYVARGAGDGADDAVNGVRSDNAWAAFSTAVNAYMVRDDATALAELTRLQRLYPEHLDTFGQGSLLMTELRRRQAEHTFVANRPPATMPTTQPDRRREAPPTLVTPADFDHWPADKRVAYLIHELQEVDQRQESQPGGVDVSADPRVAALVKIGDDAVPALIDCVDRDGRLTRSVEFWRDFSQHRTIVSVRECALSAVESIIGSSVFEPVSTGDSFTARGEEAAHATAKRLRAYWAKYGKLGPAQRQMTILTDPEAPVDAAGSAAFALAHFNEDRRIGTMVWTGGAAPKPGTNPVINQFVHPTVAEAILALYDREMSGYDAAHANAEPGLRAWQRKHRAREYGEMFVTLQDRRIATPLDHRFTAALADRRSDDARLWAAVCYGLADERPMFAVAERVRAGTFTFGAVDPKADDWFSEPGVASLTAWVNCLANAGTPFADDAIRAVADPAHPYHALAAEAVRRTLVGGRGGDDDDNKVWGNLPLTVRLARPLLDDVTTTDTHYEIRDGELRYKSANGSGSSSVPDLLANPAARRDSADERTCDAVGEKLSGMLVGCPPVHPMFKDEDARLAALRLFVDAHGQKLRPLPTPWRSALGLDPWDGAFYPSDAVDWSDHSLPKRGQLTAPGRDPEPVLVVHVDRDRAGRPVRYRVLGRHALAEVPAGRVSDVGPLPPE